LLLPLPFVPLVPCPDISFSLPFYFSATAKQNLKTLHRTTGERLFAPAEVPLSFRNQNPNLLPKLKPACIRLLACFMLD
jgi:hypothetical protein